MSNSNNNQLDFKGIIIIEAELEAITGLHIGGSKESFEIGGIDNPVIKVPKTFSLPDGREIKEGMPYIPGSSLKGKIRSLLEILKGNAFKNGEPCSCGECEICRIFGAHKTKEEGKRQPVRLKVEDAYPTKETLEKWEKEDETLYSELKVENVINRLTSKATPRKLERVYAGTKFKVRMTYEIFNEQDVEEFKYVLIGMKLLEDSYLGGGGSRGNGRVKFKNIEIKFRGKDYYTSLDKSKEKEIITNSNNPEDIDFNTIKTKLEEILK